MSVCASVEVDSVYSLLADREREIGRKEERERWYMTLVVVFSRMEPLPVMMTDCW